MVTGDEVPHHTWVHKLIQAAGAQRCFVHFLEQSCTLVDQVVMVQTVKKPGNHPGLVLMARELMGMGG